MFAVIETGGKQYKAEKGKTIEVEKLEGKEGASVSFDRVLLVSDDKGTKVGTPTIDGASVEAKITSDSKGDKVRVFKMKAKKRYQKTQGHRQKYTLVEITDIKFKAAAPKADKAEKSEKSEKPAAKPKASTKKAEK